jgi:hypothetical protein
LQNTERICVAKVFELYETRRAESVHGCVDEFFNERVVFGPGETFLAQANVMLVFEQVLVVCTNVERYWQAFLRIHTSQSSLND